MFQRTTCFWPGFDRNVQLNHWQQWLDNHRHRLTNNHLHQCTNNHRQIIIGSNGPIITGSDGQIITGTIVYPILFTGSMNSLNPYHVTPCDRSVAHIIWYTVTCLPEGQCYVPDNLEVRRQVVSQYHDTLSAGHPGQLKTQELVQWDYWWPGLATFVKNYVKGCALCQQHKINQHPTNPPLQPVAADHPQPFSLIAMDFITDLPVSDGFDSIMVMVDHGSMKGVILESCNKMITAEQMGTILLTSLYKCVGLPDKAI